jgi:hypothetical protein
LYRGKIGILGVKKSHGVRREYFMLKDVNMLIILIFITIPSVNQSKNESRMKLILYEISPSTKQGNVGNLKLDSD